MTPFTTRAELDAAMAEARRILYHDSPRSHLAQFIAKLEATAQRALPSAPPTETTRA